MSGAIHFAASIKFDMAALEQFQPDQIEALFTGIGECVGIQNEIRRKEANRSGPIPLSILHDVEGDKRVEAAIVEMRKKLEQPKRTRGRPRGPATKE